MRAAGAWGNGGSNTITIQQMPAHTHSMRGFFKTYANVAGSGYATAPIDWDTLTTTSVGGGNRSTPLTKMFGRGTELLREGDALCVTFNKFKSVLRAASRKFVHSQLAISICQVTRQAQQALTEVRGHLSQILGFCGQAVRGIQQAAKVRILLLHKKCHHILTVFGIVLVNRQLPKKLSLLSQVGLDRVGADIIWMPLAAMLHTITSRLTAPAIVGIAPLKAGEC